MNVYLWHGMVDPNFYYHISLVVVAETLDKAILLAMENPEVQELSARMKQLWKQDLGEWLVANVQTVTLDQPAAFYSEYWA